ncbi:MAG TPA: hypothetical protein VFO16_03460 [Pseudonocardiaceae bacterium]|nr:hypothetical protein [Pseudonocardiaceae bacterium]
MIEEPVALALAGVVQAFLDSFVDVLVPRNPVTGVFVDQRLTVDPDILSADEVGHRLAIGAVDRGLVVRHGCNSLTRANAVT